MNTIDLGTKVAIITGGAGGVGLATARRMVAYGAKVVLIDIDDELLATAKLELPSVTTRRIDLLDEESSKAEFALIEKEFDRIDILVNSIGYEGIRANVDEQKLSDWQRTIDINLTAPFIAAKLVVPYMKKREYGRIVFLSSTAGKDGNAGVGAYSSAKAAIIALTKCLGKELAKTGIRVNCVTPVALDSALYKRMTEEAQKIALGRIPMGRLGNVDEVAALICWLASEDCSFSTGAIFDVSGGRSTY